MLVKKKKGQLKEKKKKDFILKWRNKLPNSFSKSITKLVLASQYIRFLFFSIKKKKKFLFFGKPVQKIVGFTIVVLFLFENSNLTMWVFSLLNIQWQMPNVGMGNTEGGRDKTNGYQIYINNQIKVTLNCFSVIYE